MDEPKKSDESAGERRTREQTEILEQAMRMVKEGRVESCALVLSLKDSSFRFMMSRGETGTVSLIAGAEILKQHILRNVNLQEKPDGH